MVEALGDKVDNVHGQILNVNKKMKVTVEKVSAGRWREGTGSDPVERESDLVTYMQLIVHASVGSYTLSITMIST